MVELTKGNLFDSGCQALVNPVNCVGVMGKGLALSFKTKFPVMFKEYAQECRLGNVVPGKMQVSKNLGGNPDFIINFPTKRHWKDKSLLEDVELGLQDLVKVVEGKGIKSIAVPPLGCGLGGLDWKVVGPMIKVELGKLDGVKVLVYVP